MADARPLPGIQLKSLTNYVLSSVRCSRPAFSMFYELTQSSGIELDEDV